MVYYYKCDPEKHKDCPKDACQKECFYTTHKEFALGKKVYTLDIKTGELKETHLGKKKR